MIFRFVVIQFIALMFAGATILVSWLLTGNQGLVGLSLFLCAVATLLPLFYFPDSFWEDEDAFAYGAAAAMIVAIAFYSLSHGAVARYGHEAAGILHVTIAVVALVMSILLSAGAAFRWEHWRPHEDHPVFGVWSALGLVGWITGPIAWLVMRLLEIYQRSRRRV